MRLESKNSRGAPPLGGRVQLVDEPKWISTLAIITGALLVPTFGLMGQNIGDQVYVSELSLGAIIGIMLIARLLSGSLGAICHFGQHRSLLALLGFLLIWIILCNFLAKEFDVLFLRQFRSSVIAVILAFLAIRVLVATNAVFESVRLWVLLGMAVKCGMYLTAEGEYLGKDEMMEQFSMNYTGLGLYAAAGLVFALHWAFSKRMGFAAKLLGLGASLYFLLAAITFENRGSMAVLACGPALFVLLRRSNKRLLKWLIGAGMIAIVISLLASGVMESVIKQIPDYSVGTAEARKTDLQRSFELRYEDWATVNVLNSGRALLFGYRWSDAIEHFSKLEHPHNIFVWMGIAGGMAGLAVSLVILLRLAFISIDVVLRRSRAGGGFDMATFWVLLMIYLVLLTNSWAAGIPVLCGVWLALIICESEYVNRLDQAEAGSQPARAPSGQGRRRRGEAFAQ